MIAQIKIIISLLIIFTFFIILCLYCCYRFLRHEKAQSARISRLEGLVEELWERLRRQQEYYNYNIEWTDDGFNFFAIGNSLTFVSDWERGICSTRPDNDYFGLIVQYFKAKQITGTEYTGNDSNVFSENSNAKVVAHRLNFSFWERATTRSSVLDLLNIFLSSKLNLVILQLGENVPVVTPDDVKQYEIDFAFLIDYIRAKASNAQIVIVDDFWSQEKSRIRRNIAEQKKCLFADLTPIRGRKEYQSKAGTKCLLPDGRVESVSKMTETHPGDEGMKYIAEQIIHALR